MRSRKNDVSQYLHYTNRPQSPEKEEEEPEDFSIDPNIQAFKPIPGNARCSHCGGDYNADYDRYCPHCGAELFRSSREDDE